MPIDRRSFIAALGAAIASPAFARGIVHPGEAIYLSASDDREGQSSITAFGDDGRLLYSTRLPSRGHDIAPRPGSGEVVVFARRPGDWAAIVDRRSGVVRQVVPSAPGRHFYGHGVFSADGRLLYATENRIETGDGVLGLYDAGSGYRRVGEVPTFGPGPHDLAFLEARRGGILVANGGIRTRPESGREILNRDCMEPSLAVIDAGTGDLIQQVDLGPALKGLSIRHLAVGADGTGAFGCQFENRDGSELPLLVGVLTPEGRAELLPMPEDDLASLDNYIGSVALDETGRLLAATSPRGSTIAFWDLSTRRYLGRQRMSDVCGVASGGGSELFVVTSGNDGVKLARVEASPSLFGSPELRRRIWDNHLVRIGLSAPTP